MKKRVRRLVAEVLGLDADAIGEDLSQDTADTWDSLNHLRIVTALEQEFEITMSMEEIQATRNVGQLIELVALRLADT